MDQWNVADDLMANEDRHFNNFGALRNSETLGWLGVSPIYDSGSSLGYDELSRQIENGQEVECKPFKKHHEEQIQLVRSFRWLDQSKLEGLDKVVREVFMQDQVENFIDHERMEAIASSLEKRVQRLKRWMRERQDQPEAIAPASTKDDVLENVAEDYSHFL